MKTRAKLLISSATLLGLMTLVACNKPQDATGTLQSGSTISTEIKDSEITTKVKTALLLDEKIKGFDIAVVTTKGDVRLTGAVDTQSQIDQVDKIVRGIEGVHSIHDELSIKK